MPPESPVETVVRTMVLWFPDWPVVAARSIHGLPPAASVAVIDRGIVIACSAEARQEGVRRGLRVREAQLRSPALTVHPHDPETDARAFDPVIAAIEQVIPGVQLIRPGLCAVRARGAARYYGGEEQAATAVLDRLLHEGHPPAVVGIADGRYTAEQAAMQALLGDTEGQAIAIVPPGASPAFLAALPIEAVDAPELAPLLRRLGARTLGDFAALDASDVRARFGEEGAAAHERAAGLDRRPVIPRLPPRDFDSGIDFEPPLDRVDQIAFALRAVAERCAGGLTSAGLVCTGIRVTVTSDRGERSEREWNHPRHFTPAEIVDRVRWQLQGSGGVEGGLESPIARVVISPTRVDAISHHEEGLWGRSPDERIHHGLSRIQSMLGHEAVLTAVPGGGRLLAERRVLVPWGDAPPPRERLAADRPWPGSLPEPAPATVYDPPLAATVLDDGESSVDVDRRGRLSAELAWISIDELQPRRRRRVTAWAGPWPLRQRWWDPARARRADRFQVLDDDGEGWLLLLEQHRWRVEAHYD
ncbi:DNA polymerase Y family protein [Salinibacterium sp. SYSU T00001]|uniref:DNA polymerase Y family protein n=1 Tax=Homoserinimonas sedimenticola TaxID=2986805 RepID=UPI0022357A05|nr:DNA polymerase Y family protein [Salinibacterium sedimenticola]MCW4384243.1 DNA polymerase Y family protein [Salinibacterium sedimenticola]